MTPEQSTALYNLKKEGAALLEQIDNDGYIPRETMLKHLDKEVKALTLVLALDDPQPEPHKLPSIVTRAKGGEHERDTPIAHITVPDLWHCAIGLQSLGMIEAGRQVLNCWHLCHDLKRHIEEFSK